MPSRGQRSSAVAKASCAHSSARSQSPVSRTRVATTRPHSAWKAAGDGGLDLGGHISQIGLTSTLPTRAPGIFAATSMASSRSLQSTR